MKLRKLPLQKQYVTIGLTSVLLLGIAAYIYFLSVSVLHVVMRKELNQKISDLHSEIASLETTYIEAHHIISSKVAAADGFNEVKEKIFITQATGQNLVLRTSNE